VKRIELNGAWEARGTDEWGKETHCFMGEVPGCVHTDLLRQGIINDIFYRDNAEQIQWIERYSWSYSKEFVLDSVEPDASVTFEGLDCYCDIFLNGKFLGAADDMFHPFSFPADGLLTVGKNTMSVFFRSPVLEVQGKKKRDAAFTCERLYTRRIQCTYGWDWVARFVTCGIWRSVSLTFGKAYAPAYVYVYTKSLDSESAQVFVDVTMKNYANGGFVTIELLAPDGKCVFHNRRYCREEQFTETADILNPALWFPTGYGAQPLYQVAVTAGEERIIHTFGVRTVKILQAMDDPESQAAALCRRLQETGSGKEYDGNDVYSGFILLINGIRIFCKGTNWVPSEPFPSAETDEKITHLLTLAKVMNLNMLRIWGGGIFEREHFYAECDRLGILVTQDFLMACGSYPEDEPWFISALQKEARHAALSLRNHPCLMWWTGDNENAACGSEDMQQYNGRTSALQGIAPVLRELDPNRTFLPSSPYGGKKYASKTRGTTHNTQFLGYTFAYIKDQPMDDYKDYFKNYIARFVAEDPTMGAASLPSLRRFLTDEDIFGSDNTMWKYHTRTNPGLSLSIAECHNLITEKLLGSFTDGHDRLFKQKYIQYEWLRVTMEIFRRNKWFNSGVLYWMLADCWPAAGGWTFLDYYGMPKASFYAFQRTAAPLIASIDRTGEDAYTVYVANDTLSAYTAGLHLFTLDTKSDTTETLEKRVVSAPANETVQAATVKCSLKETEVLLCEMTFGNQTDRAFYKTGKLPIVPTDRVKVIEKTKGSITVTADRYVHVVELEGDALFSDSYFSLLPGEVKTVTFRPLAEEKPEISICGYKLEE